MNISCIKNTKPVVIIPTIIGIYFLINDEEIVYIGKSVNIVSRILDHRKDAECKHAMSKVFTSVQYVEVGEPELDYIERLLINHIKPKYNRMICRNVYNIKDFKHLVEVKNDY